MERSQREKTNFWRKGILKNKSSPPKLRKMQQFQIYPDSEITLKQLQVKNQENELKTKTLQRKLKLLMKEDKQLDQKIIQRQDQLKQNLLQYWNFCEQEKLDSEQLEMEMSQGTQFMSLDPLFFQVLKNNTNHIQCQLCGQLVQKGQQYIVTPCCLLYSHDKCLKTIWSQLQTCPNCSKK